MKYIEIDSYGKKIQFTTRSVFIDGKEYPYSQMSSVRYSLEKKVYAFKCGDEVQYIRYEDKDEKALSAIFSQIRKMHQKRDAAAAAKATAPAGAHAFSVADVMSGKEVSSSDVASRFTTRISVQDLLDAHEKELAGQAPVPAEKLAEEVAAEETAAAVETTAAAETAVAAVEETAAEEVPAETGESVQAAAETAAETTEEAAEAAVEAAEEKVEEKADDAKETAADSKAAAAAAKAEAKAQAQAEKEKQRAEKEKAKQEKAAAKAKEREEKAKAKAEKAAAAGETGKQSRFKKAIIIFIVILMFFVALGCVWYATVGLSSSPASGPAATESQSYDDIDQMIQDLEE